MDRKNCFWLQGFLWHILLVFLMGLAIFLSFLKIIHSLKESDNKECYKNGRIMYSISTHSSNDIKNQKYTPPLQQEKTVAVAVMPFIPPILGNKEILTKLSGFDILLLLLIWVEGVILTQSLYRALKRINTHIDGV
ncbi:MAG: hypothetical protein GY821_08315 [Gammaproteobacteria bacterium]|nr:hypothetical protein [Gammaproteobacteria bacterium]